jgi:hypothetical protein
LSEGEQALCSGCATRVVIDERLGRRLLVDDHEPIRAANHVFEFFVLVTRDKGEAIVLAPNLLVFGNRHLDPPLAGNVFVASRPALAKKLETFQLSSWPRFFGYPFDPLVYLPDQRFVSRLPVKTGFHDDSSTPLVATGQEPRRFARHCLTASDRAAETTLDDLPSVQTTGHELDGLDVQQIAPPRFIPEHALKHRLGLSGRLIELNHLLDLV